MAVPDTGVVGAGEMSAAGVVMIGVPSVEGVTGCWVQPAMRTHATRRIVIQSSLFIINDCHPLFYLFSVITAKRAAGSPPGLPSAP